MMASHSLYHAIRSVVVVSVMVVVVVVILAEAIAAMGRQGLGTKVSAMSLQHLADLPWHFISHLCRKQYDEAGIETCEHG